MKRKQLALSSAFRPALPLLFSLVAQSLVAALGGAAVIETVFALPGIGADASHRREIRKSLIRRQKGPRRKIPSAGERILRLRKAQQTKKSKRT